MSSNTAAQFLSMAQLVSVQLFLNFPSTSFVSVIRSHYSERLFEPVLAVATKLCCTMIQNWRSCFALMVQGQGSNDSIRL